MSDYRVDFHKHCRYWVIQQEVNAMELESPQIDSRLPKVKKRDVRGRGLGLTYLGIC